MGGRGGAGQRGEAVCTVRRRQQGQRGEAPTFELKKIRKRERKMKVRAREREREREWEWRSACFSPCLGLVCNCFVVRKYLHGEGNEGAGF